MMSNHTSTMGHFGGAGRAPQPARRRAQEAIEFKIMFWVAFPVFLLAAMVGRLLPRRAGLPVLPGEPRPSLIKEARIAAAAMIPFAFMG
jgi:hypothetical protein